VLNVRLKLLATTYLCPTLAVLNENVAIDVSVVDIVGGGVVGFWAPVVVVVVVVPFLLHGPYSPLFSPSDNPLG
jgi:hypothetical protein